eukprot:EG_transcript_406
MPAAERDGAQFADLPAPTDADRSSARDPGPPAPPVFGATPISPLATRQPTASAAQKPVANKADNLVDAAGNPEEAPGPTQPANPEESPPVAPAKAPPPPRVPLRQLFRFADRWDRCAMAAATLCGVVTGASLPAFSFLFGELINELARNTANVKHTSSELSLWLTVLGIGTWALTAAGVAAFSVSGERQARRMRRAFFSAILDQEVAYFDHVKAGELTNRMSSDMTLVATLLGDKLFLLSSQLATFLLSFVFAFVHSWRLTLLMLAITPVLAVAGGVIAKLVTDAPAKAQEAYAQAGAIAQEVLAAIRTVHAFDGMERECLRYDERLAETQKVGIKKGLYSGLSLGIIFFILFSSYAVAFYFGSYLIEWGFDTGGSIVAVFFSVLVGAFTLGACGPIFTAMAEAQGAAFKVYEVIDRSPGINAKVDAPGKVLTTTEGHIEFRDVSFTYPARPDVPIFAGLSLTIEPGQKVALVGPSGGGKSSVVALLERFYDPAGGAVLVDGVPLPEVNLHSWRRQVGVVTQEPTLFQASVLDNIRCADPNATEADVEQACKDAFIHDVISKLPSGYHTMVGEAGCQLSGGQKQRVAIARAILRNPKVLLLDEATSALDRQSEVVVQEALKNVMRGRTVLTIAHRLVTVQDCDRICYIEPRDPAAPAGHPAAASRLLEAGTHEELMRLGGAYCEMVHAQSRAAEQPEAESSAIAPERREYDSQVEPTAADTARDAVDLETGDADTVQRGKRIGKGRTKGEEKSESHVFRRTAKLSSPDKVYIAVGVVAAAILGSTHPLYAIIFSEVVNVFYRPDMRAQVWWWCLLFVGLGLMNLVCNVLKTHCLNLAGENLTYRLRSLLFRALVAQDVGFFDLPGHESGALCARLASDTTEIQRVWAGAISANTQAAVCLTAGTVIAFVASWELALIVLSAMPAVGIAGYLNNKLMFDLFQKSNKDAETAGQVASESITGHRTVFAFNMQQAQVDRYDSLLSGPANAAGRKAMVSGFFIGFSKFIIFAAFALAFWYGGQMIGDGRLSFTNVMMAAFALLMGAMGVGEVYSMAGDQAAAKTAAIRVYEILDRVPQIDAVGDSGLKLAAVSGHGTFRDVCFAYPSRPTVPVLKGLDLAFHVGQRVAVLGNTGCGKSTVIALLMRYYDPTAGEVLPDGHRMADLNLRSWRRFVGVVSQEPVLFDTSIASNIKYSRPDATDEEMYEAAQKANIHDVILSLPEGYQTNVGAKGSQLSGGQKQRVAIARCLLRKPAILLLDEATSALDNVSEKEVQAALDRIVAEEQMTVITVAHRLSTIQNCNVIAIMDQGRVLEMGSHEQLYALGGDYRRRYDQYYGIGS